MTNRSFIPARTIDPLKAHIQWQFLTPDGVPLERTSVSEGTDILQHGNGNNWDCSNNGLVIRVELEIARKHIWGMVVPENATVALVVEWLSHDSLARDIGPATILDPSIGFIQIATSVIIQPGKLRKSFMPRATLALVTPGDPQPGMATHPGMILCEWFCSWITLSDSKSMFPIMECNEPGSPPWWVEIGMIDPLEDPFDESVFRLVVNRHWADSCQELTSLNSNLSPYQATVFGSAIQMLMTRTAFFQDAWHRILTEDAKKLPAGSIAALVKAWRDHYHWTDNPLTAPDTLQKRIQADLIGRKIP